MILVTLPYCTKDVHLVKPLLEWIRELWQNQKRGSALLAADSKVPRETILEIRDLAKNVFRHAETMLVNTPDDRQKWPEGANWMFFQVSGQVVQCYKTPFLWMEPDCVPLHRTWMDAIERDYDLQPKRFMGPFIHNAAKELTTLPAVHMAGVAVYPIDAHRLLKAALAGAEPFDIASAHEVVGQQRASDTKLIYHLWGNHTSSPTFKASKGPADGANVLTLEAIPPKAVLFHRCKDGSLIKLLREVLTNPIVVDPRFSDERKLLVTLENAFDKPMMPKIQTEKAVLGLNETIDKIATDRKATEVEVRSKIGAMFENVPPYTPEQLAEAFTKEPEPIPATDRP